MNHLDIVKSQFKKQAADFSGKDSNQTNEKYITWILDSLTLENDHSVLDVAGGTGILSRTLARKVKHVTTLDVSTDMLKQGKIEAMAEDIGNISFVEGTVEHLPFNSSDFDVVVCRFAFHHFIEPQEVLLEMVRVCKEGGKVAVVDIICTEDSVLANSYNHYEQLRDPSHTRALNTSEFVTMYQQAGLSIDEVKTMDVEVDFSKWIALTHLDTSVASQIAEDVIAEVQGARRTGLRPFHRDGKLYFHHTYMKIIGQP